MKKLAVLIIICAVALLSVVSINAEAETRYKYYEYYYDSQGNDIGFGYFVYGAMGDEATYECIYVTYHVLGSDNTTWSSLDVAAFYFYKDEDGEWQYHWSWMLPQWEIDEYFGW